jgi:hypothetical protein
VAPSVRDLHQDAGHELQRVELASTLATRQRVDVKDFRDQPRPRRGAAALLGRLLLVFCRCRRLLVAIASDAQQLLDVLMQTSPRPSSTRLDLV